MPRIPLMEFHVEKLGAETGFFGGWEVPMRYTSSLKEHVAVREHVGVFDVSHMGRLVLEGPDTLPLIQKIYTRDLSKTREGWMSGPTLVLNQYARVKDDEMLYKVDDEKWLIVVNALYREKMLEYINSIIMEEALRVKLRDITKETSMIAVQGPHAGDVFEKIGAGWLRDLKPLEFRVNAEIGGTSVFLVSRSGWTGEDGFEVWGDHKSIRELIVKLIDAGATPVGIIARDTLRMEMGFVLGEHEYGEDPMKYPCALSLRYGLGAIDWKKTGYIGWEMLHACRRNGVRWVRIGLKMSKKSARIIPRQGMQLYVYDQVVGWVTSGAFSPILKRGIGQAYIDVRYALFGEPVELVVRGKRHKAKIVDFPLITPKGM